MSNNPEILTYVPFAINGQKNTVPVDHVSGTDDRLASQRGGWPAICLIPKSAGGQPPDGMDLNGYLYQLSLDTVHRQSGKVMQFDADYASNIGGYSKGALLQSTDLSTFWISTSDKNLTDPDSSSASNWKQFAYTPIASSTTQGTVKLADTLNSTAKDTALTANQGNVLANMLASVGNGQTIGAHILKWGEALINSRVTVDPNYVPTTIEFDTPFPNQCLQVVACHNDPVGANAIFSVGNLTKNGFDASSYKMRANGENQAITAFSGTTTMRYFAIGN